MMGTVGILGTLPFLVLLKRLKLAHTQMEMDITTIVFIYLNFLPGVAKLYFGQNIDKIWLNVLAGLGDAWLYSLLAQLVYMSSSSCGLLGISFNNKKYSIRHL